MSEQRSLADDLRSENVQRLVSALKINLNASSELRDLAEKAEQDIKFNLERYVLSLKTTKFRTEELEAFISHPYHLYPVPKKNRVGELTGEVRKDAWFLAIPKFIDAQFGWLDHETPSHRVFVINRYMDWLGELPAEVKKEIGWRDTLPVQISGDRLTGPKEAVDKAYEKYKQFLRKDGNLVVVNPKRTFELLAAMIADGILPFTPNPVAGEDLIDPPRIKGEDFETRPYQIDAWKKFLQYSHVGIFFPPSTGKTWMGLRAMASLRGPHLVLVPTTTLQDQWSARLEAHTTLKEGEDVIITTYQSGIKRYSEGFKQPDGKIVEWGLLAVDEGHHLPADEFSKMAIIHRRWTMLLSATPFREDGREDFIFAFSGYPIGLSWEYFRTLGLIRKPVAHLWIVKTLDRKLKKIADLLKEEKRTVIFCDSIELGRTIASRFNIPHIHGETKEDRIELIDKAFTKPPYALVGSRVLDEGVSLPAIQRIIEIDWLGGSRRQELQRYTRLLHSKEEEEGESFILMTEDEYRRDRERFFSLMDKGFSVQSHLDEQINEQALTKRLREPGFVAPRRPRAETKSESPTETVPSAEIAPSGKVAGLMDLPGIRKVIDGLTGPQQRFYKFLLQNDGTWFDSANVGFFGAQGYPSLKHWRDVVDPGKLVQRKLIEKDKTRYRTNLSGSKN